MAQIRHQPSGRELLMSARRPYCAIPPDRPWVEYDTSGMDDCFPNVDEGRYPFEPWKARQLPQMGEWVRGAWGVVREDTSSVTLERTGFVLPYTAEKRIELDESTLRLSYHIRNTGPEEFSYVWSAHPLIAVQENFRLRLPGHDLRFVTFPDDGAIHRWPTHDGFDLSREWLAHGRTLKVFVSGLAEGWCEVIADCLPLRFDFDLKAIPFVGLWFNNYGFAGGGPDPFRCIAVEPCTSPTDVLHALPRTAYPSLAPGADARWSWSLRVG